MRVHLTAPFISVITTWGLASNHTIAKDANNTTNTAAACIHHLREIGRSSSMETTRPTSLGDVARTACTRAIRR
ncbi:MAG TPA: hypothetical protein QF683_12490 [SAR324 cluster bacterium]|nr:hypothetical protein [SAR324 cluster bacterium]